MFRESAAIALFIQAKRDLQALVELRTDGIILQGRFEQLRGHIMQGSSLTDGSFEELPLVIGTQLYADYLLDIDLTRRFSGM